LRFSIENNDERPDYFKFEFFLNKKSILKIDSELHSSSTDKSQFQLIISGIGIPLEPGHLGFSVKLYSNKELLLSEKNKSALAIEYVNI